VSTKSSTGQDGNASDDASLLSLAEFIDCPNVALRDVRVEQTRCGIVLSGQVKSFHHKQLAQEAVRRQVNDVSVSNRIEVLAHRPLTAETSGDETFNRSPPQ